MKSKAFTITNDAGIRGLHKFWLIIIGLIAMAAFASPVGAATTLGISGDKFTLNGQPTFLLGVSYFDVLGWRTSDLDALQARRFNMVRIFLDWNVWPGGHRLRSCFNPDGSMKNTASLVNFVRACAARGMVVDVAILHVGSNELKDWTSSSFPQIAIRNAVRLLAPEPNVLFDLVNEHNGFTAAGKNMAWSDSHALMKSLVTAARLEKSNAILTVSSLSMVFPGYYEHILRADDSVNPAIVDEELATGIDVMTPHFGREVDWYSRTDRRVLNLKNHITSRGKSTLIYLQEENRRSTAVDNGEGGGNIPKEHFFQAVMEAKYTGAAAWLFHTRAGFDLATSSFFAQLDPQENEIANGIGQVAFGGNTSPSVSITGPANGSTFTAPATITVSANASDSDGTVSKVDFYRNGTLIGTDTASPYAIVMSGVAAGSYQLTAKATDNAGAITTSATVTITANAPTPTPTPTPTPNAPPVVSITSPANGSIFTAPATITVSANASDSNGTVSTVEFLRNGVSVGTDTASPYSWIISSLAAGSYSLIAKATDNAGAVTYSATVSITVNAPTPTTLPDAVVTAFSYANGIFNCTVMNQGNGSTPSGALIGVGYSVDGVWRTYGTVTGPLAAGASVNIGTNGGSYIIPDGTHTIRAWVDDAARFTESNENNNQFSKTITVGTVQQTLAPPTITAPANGATLGGTSATISWNSVSGAASYLVRCQDMAGTTPKDSRNTPNSSTAFLYIDKYLPTSITMNVVPGHSYNFWIHASLSTYPSGGSTSYSVGTYRSFSVIATALTGSVSGSFNVTPEADTYNYQFTPSTNYGAATDFNVGGGSTGHIRVAYLRFNVSELPAGATVTDARLSLVCMNPGLGGELRKFLPTTAQWSESGPTWNNPLAGVDGSGALSTLGTVNMQGTYVFTNLAGSVSANGRVTFVIRSGDVDGAGYFSREHGITSQRPILRVTYVTVPTSSG
jgi:hypothetical protein